MVCIADGAPQGKQSGARMELTQSEWIKELQGELNATGGSDPFGRVVLKSIERRLTGHREQLDRLIAGWLPSGQVARAASGRSRAMKSERRRGEGEAANKNLENILCGPR